MQIIGAYEDNRAFGQRFDSALMMVAQCAILHPEHLIKILAVQRFRSRWCDLSAGDMRGGSVAQYILRLKKRSCHKVKIAQDFELRCNYCEWMRDAGRRRR